MQQITKEQFEDYVSGWLICNQGDFPGNLTMGNMKAALQNAYSQIECDQDGIEAVIERKKYYDELETN